MESRSKYGTFEQHVMPNGKVVYYRDSDHSYYGEVHCTNKKRDKWAGVAATRLPSISTISKYADTDKDSLLDWVERVTLEGFEALRGDPMPMGDAWNVDTFRTTLLRKKLTWRQIREARGEIGSVAHDRFERLLAGEKVVPVEKLAKEYQGHCNAVDKHMKELQAQDWELLQQETVVYSDKYGYAGRFDARLKINGEVWLLDGKVSGYIGKAYHNQLAGYDLAAVECGYGKTDHIGILQWNDDGTYRIWPCHGTKKGFLLNLASYNDGRRLDKLIQADREETNG